MVAVAAALADVEKLVHDLSDEDATRRTGCPGWSVFDVVAHCVSLESLLAGDPDPDHEIEVIPDHVRTDSHRFMEVLVDARRDLTFDELVAQVGQVFDRRQQQLAVIEDLDVQVTWFAGTTSTRSMLERRTFDMWAHEQDIRRATGRPGGLASEPAVAALRTMLRGLAAFLPARMPPHAGTLDLIITGEQSSATTIRLGDGAESVRLSIPFADLVPLVCGRDDAGDPASVAVIEGDTSLASVILTSLSITP